MGKIRVLVIDDSAFNRRTIAEILDSSDDIEVVDIAVNGEDGLKKLMKLKPDVVTVDLEMPVMDGFSFIRVSMANAPTPCVVVSSKKDDVNVFKALDLGAVEFVGKPTATVSTKLYNIKSELIDKVKIASHTILNNVKNNINKYNYIETYSLKKKSIPPSQKPSYRTFDFSSKKIDLVAIGSSTGGPSALKHIFHLLPINLNVAIVISQHMPQGFTTSFSQRLNRTSGYIIKEAKDGDILEKGKVLISPGGKHMTLHKSDVEDTVTIKLTDGEPTDANIPCVTKMFNSVAKIFKQKVLAVVLTGMGADGKEGVLNIKKQGGMVIAESDKTAVVFGMPNEAIKTGKVDKVVPLDKIADAISKICRQSK